MICESVEQSGGAVELVLFDLDGTFADTAPDMAYALNRTLEQNGRSPLPLATIRPHVSHGGIALIRLGFGIEPDHPEFALLRQQFLDIYRDNLARDTKLFAGMEALLTQLERLHDLLIREVVLEQAGDVYKVSAVSVPPDQVTPANNSPYFQAADASRRQLKPRIIYFSRRACRHCRRKCLFLKAQQRCHCRRPRHGPTDKRPSCHL